MHNITSQASSDDSSHFNSAKRTRAPWLEDRNAASRKAAEQEESARELQLTRTIEVYNTHRKVKVYYLS